MATSREAVKVNITKYVFEYTYIFVKKNMHHHDVKGIDGVSLLCCFPDSIRSIIKFLMMLPDQMNVLSCFQQ